MINMAKIPDWMATKKRTSICDGVVWWANEHIMLRTNETDGDKDPEFVSVFDSAISIATERLTPGRVSVVVAGFDACDVDEFGGPGGDTTHYKVEMGPGLQAMLMYVAIVEYLYGAVSWHGRGSFEPIVAKLGSTPVAVMMPAPNILTYA